MPTKPEFHEDLASNRVDPLAPTHQDFDYEQVYRDLDDDLEVDWQDDDLHEKLIQFARRILEYAVDTELSEGADRRIGRRLLTLAWVINPGFFPDSPSLASLARSIGVDAGTLARLTSEASRTFGITNRAQARWLTRKRSAQPKPARRIACRERVNGPAFDPGSPQTHPNAPGASSGPESSQEGSQGKSSIGLGEGHNPASQEGGGPALRGPSQGVDSGQAAKRPSVHEEAAREAALPPRQRQLRRAKCARGRQRLEAFIKRMESINRFLGEER